MISRERQPGSRGSQGGCARGKAEEAQRPLPRGHCVSWDASSCLLPRGRTGLGFKRLKEMWKGCVRSALLVWVLGRHILSLGSFSKLAFTGGWVGEGEKGRRLCPGPARWGTAFLSASLTFHGNPSPVGLPPTTLSRIPPGPLLPRPYGNMRLIL